MHVADLWLEALVEERCSLDAVGSEMAEGPLPSAPCREQPDGFRVADQHRPDEPLAHVAGVVSIVDRGVGGPRRSLDPSLPEWATHLDRKNCAAAS